MDRVQRDLWCSKMFRHVFVIHFVLQIVVECCVIWTLPRVEHLVHLVTESSQLVLLLLLLQSHWTTTVSPIGCAQVRIGSLDILNLTLRTRVAIIRDAVACAIECLNALSLLELIVLLL